MRTLLLLLLALPAAARDQVAATVGTRTIGVAEIDAKIATALEAAERDHHQKVYTLRREQLDELVEAALLEAEAKRRGVEVAALLEAEVTAKAEKPTEAETKAVFEQFKERVGDASFEQVRGEIEAWLGQRARDERHQAFVADLRKRGQVRVALEPIRVKVSADGAGSWGAKEPKVTIVVFADYECPYCARGAGSLEEVMKTYGDRVRVVYRDFPLDFHKPAVPAASAARWAGAQGKYRQMHDGLYATQQDLSERSSAAAMARLKLDAEAFAACQADDKTAEAVAADQRAGAAAGVEGTPAFFINGILLSGAQPAEAFAEIIEDELMR